ncbi:hypothetical protein FRX31_011613, partial [Thalictrum thalictroides]
MNELQEKTDEYGDLLSLIQHYMGHQPPDVLCDAACQVLSLLKHEKIDKDKKEIEDRLNKTELLKDGDEKKKLQLFNFENLADLKRGFLKADEKIDLEFPKGSIAQLKNGYLEVNVPPMMRKPLDCDEVFVKVDEMPDWAQPAFE